MEAYLSKNNTVWAKKYITAQKRGKIIEVFLRKKSEFFAIKSIYRIFAVENILTE